MKRILRKAMVLAALGVVLLLISGRMLPRRWPRWLPRPSVGRDTGSARPTPAAKADPGAPQQRVSGRRVAVPRDAVHVDDGDTVQVRWPDGSTEDVRILGIDAPEIAHPSHGRPFGQKEGPEALAYAQRAFGQARVIELLRAATLDAYGRTLGYLFLDGRNYSQDIIGAGLAYETISKWGDNGLSAEAAGVMAAARRAGTPTFEAPYLFRRRMKQMERENAFRNPAPAAPTPPAR
jgi:endonuclease YncB( thermonuclease family)